MATEIINQPLLGQWENILFKLIRGGMGAQCCREVFVLEKDK